MTTFSTPEAAIAACESAGLEPRRQYGGLGETTYWVYLNGSYQAFWTAPQFLSWANHYFTEDGNG